MQKLKKYLQISIITFLFALHALAFAAINYAFPHYDQAIITGGEVKRMDKDGFIDAQNPADGPTRDVYFIYTRELNGTKAMPYRNGTRAGACRFILNLTPPTSKPPHRV